MATPSCTPLPNEYTSADQLARAAANSKLWEVPCKKLLERDPDDQLDGRGGSAFQPSGTPLGLLRASPRPPRRPFHGDGKT